MAFALAVPGTAAAITYAPVDQPGPPLSVPKGALEASLQCSGSPDAGPTPVLLVHGTGSNPSHNFAWNWEPALDKLGISWCAVALPGNGLLDVQDAGEYVVNAIRTMYAAAGRRISILGHSQGGMLPRWAFRFWPDTRSMVEDDIGFAASNHGTTGAELICQIPCAAADWQQSDKAQFIAALNSYQETFPGISYTEIYSHTDEIVMPNADDTGSSSVHDGGGAVTNVAIQDLCPADPSEHLAVGTQDNVAYDLAVDALTHAGPADPARAMASDPSICVTPLMPGINPVTYPTDLAQSAADLAANTASAPTVSAEPPLRCYVTASCGRARAAVESRAKCRKRKHRKPKGLADGAKTKHRKCKKKR